MARNLARGSGQKSIPVLAAKAKVIDLIADGYTVAQAMSAVGRKEATYWDWRKTDPAFRERIDAIRGAAAARKSDTKPEVPDFPEFCAEWLHQPLFPHQLRMWDVIQGKEPRDLDPSMTYVAGQENRVVINVPPDHAKSTTWTVNYPVWRIHKDPDVRVLVVSKGSGVAENFLYEIKQKLTSPVYQEMHLRFAPEGGWKDVDGAWTNDRIYVKGKNTGETVQRDPTVQAMGLKGQIYSRRVDIVIMDDIVDTTNAGETNLQLRIINRDAQSRLPSDEEGGGLFLVLGTRVAPMDIYRILLDLVDYEDNQVWTYFRQPAVLDYGDGDSASWRTLWPKRWPGKSLARRRLDGSWNLIYQQLDLEDDMTFKAEAVNASVNNRRFPGPMSGDGPGHRPGGMQGLYIVGGLDPAVSGNTAMIVAGLDPMTGKRWILDGFNQPNCSPQRQREQIKKFTQMYGIHEWVIEKNAYQGSIPQEPELVEFLRAHSCKISSHYTTANKRDADWGIATMAPLFDSCVVADPKVPSGWRRVTEGALIELPSTRQNRWVNDLVQQLTTWMPEGQAQKQKTDLVMALWFTHIAFMDKLNKKTTKQTHFPSPFSTPGQRKRQGVIDLVAIREARRQSQWEATA